MSQKVTPEESIDKIPKEYLVMLTNMAKHQTEDRSKAFRNRYDQLLKNGDWESAFYVLKGKKMIVCAFFLIFFKILFKHFMQVLLMFMTVFVEQ